MPVSGAGEHVAQNGLQEGRNLHALEQQLGYTFRDQSLLRQALTHPSCDGEVNYERLEFLGDAVIELVVSELLFKAYPEAAEGDLSQKRAAIVCTAGLADLAQSLSLGEYLVLGKAEVKSQGRRKLKILEDAMEAVLGAIYADCGYDAARGVAVPLFTDRVAHVGRGVRSDDYKSQFQELVQAEGKERIEYVMTDQYGPPHEPTFEVALTVAGRPLCAGVGSSKKRAEQQAAKYAVEHFRALYDTIDGRPRESAHQYHKDAQELDRIMRMDDLDMFGWPSAPKDDVATPDDVERWTENAVREVYDLTIDGDPVRLADDAPEREPDERLADAQMTLEGNPVPLAVIVARRAVQEAREAEEAKRQAEFERAGIEPADPAEQITLDTTLRLVREAEEDKRLAELQAAWEAEEERRIAEQEAWEERRWQTDPEPPGTDGPDRLEASPGEDGGFASQKELAALDGARLGDLPDADGDVPVGALDEAAALDGATAADVAAAVDGEA